MPGRAREHRRRAPRRHSRKRAVGEEDRDALGEVGGEDLGRVDEGLRRGPVCRSRGVQPVSHPVEARIRGIEKAKAVSRHEHRRDHRPQRRATRGAIRGHVDMDATPAGTDVGERRVGRAGVFAGGDMVPAERTVTVAVGHGKKAARHIDGYLRGTAYVPAPKHPVATFDKLTTWYYAEAPHQHRPSLEGPRRASTFDEVVQGLDEETAKFEARRCMSCGNCFGCDNCFGVCPDNAVKKTGIGKGYAIDYDYCKGCGVCVAECPCGSITMVPEE